MTRWTRFCVTGTWPQNRPRASSRRVCFQASPMATVSARKSPRPRADAPLNKHELAYRLIRERIEAGVYQPGQRLVIDGLARDLNMSQVPIREAIRRLQ